MKSLRALFCCALLVSSSGCVISRQIKEVDAHPTFNNYKVQTVSVHYAVFSSWFTWEMWTCHHEGDRFVCEEVDLERAKRGTHWGAGAPAAAETTPHQQLATSKGSSQ